MSMYLIRVGLGTSVGVQTQSMDQFYGRWSPDFRFGHDFLISVTKKLRLNDLLSSNGYGVYGFEMEKKEL